MNESSKLFLRLFPVLLTFQLSFPEVFSVGFSNKHFGWLFPVYFSFGCFQQTYTSFSSSVDFSSCFSVGFLQPTLILAISSNSYNRLYPAELSIGFFVLNFLSAFSKRPFYQLYPAELSIGFF